MSTTIENFMKIATKEQKDILFKLSEFAEQEKKLSNEINRIYNSIESGVYSPDGFSVTLCENEDDAKVISSGKQQELIKIKEQMKEYMIEAVKLGMGDLGIIQRNYEHYVGKPLSN